MPTAAQDEKNEKATAADKAEAKVEPAAEDALTFSISRLRAQADQFFQTDGFKAADVSGAYAGVGEDTEVTLSDAKKRIRDWRKAPVQTDEG